MLEKGHIFVYGNAGVCRVENICVKDCGAGKKEYYELAPVFDSRSTLYIPVDSPAFSANAKELLTEAEVRELMDFMAEATANWEPNDKIRGEVFRKILEKGDRKEVALLILSLYSHKAEIALRGKKLRSSDEVILLRAEKLLFGEFAYVLKTEQKEIAESVKEKIG